MHKWFGIGVTIIDVFIKVLECHKIEKEFNFLNKKSGTLKHTEVHLHLAAGLFFSL